MKNENFDRWCRRATAQIRYGPDREAVKEELMAHLEDHYDILIGQGLSAEEAEEKALTAMGDAKEIAPQLEAVHKPWLGYLYSVVRFAAVAAAIWAVVTWAVIGGSTVHHMISAHNFDSLPANFAPLDYYDHPEVTDHSDGYQFQVTEVGYNCEKSKLYYEFRIIHWPWQKITGINHQFWAVDSLANIYGSVEGAYSENPRIFSHGMSATGCIASYYMVIEEFDCDAQWVELHYDRDGRDVVLRIDLTGGDGQ